MCTYPRALALLLSLSGGSSNRSRMSKKPRATPVDEAERRRIQSEATRAAKASSQPRKKVPATRKRKGKEARKSYNEMSAVEYATLRQRD